MEDRPDGAKSLLRAYLHGPLGLAFFMAWIYLTFYSKVVYPQADYGLSAEAPWLFAMALSGLFGIAVCAAVGHLDFGSLFSWKAFAVAAAIACAAGDALVRLGAEDLPVAAAVGATFAALGFVALTLIWFDFVARGDEASIEFAVPASFIVSSLIFALASVCPAAVALAITIALPFVSVAFLFASWKREGSAGEDAAPGREVASGASTEAPAASSLTVAERKELVTPQLVCLTLLMLVFRAGYGMDRALGGDLSDSSSLAVFVAGLMSVIVFAAFIVIALKMARVIDSSLVTRWVLPLLLLSLALSSTGSSELFPLASLCKSAYSCILQALMWILFAKAAHRRPGSSALYGGCYLIALGLGMALGLLVGLGLRELPHEDLLGCLPFVICALVACVMLLDGNARRFGANGSGTEREARFAPAGRASRAEASMGTDRRETDREELRSSDGSAGCAQLEGIGASREEAQEPAEAKRAQALDAAVPDACEGAAGRGAAQAEVGPRRGPKEAGAPVGVGSVAGVASAGGATAGGAPGAGASPDAGSEGEFGGLHVSSADVDAAPAAAASAVPVAAVSAASVTSAAPAAAASATPAAAAPAAAGDAFDQALRGQARAMAERYRLSPREEEILYYLLSGRNRPYIRDALFISLNTVNTHIRNVFAKVDVHSQQELLDVAREEFPAHL